MRPDTHEVVVVGAGVAGLSVTTALLDAGLDVLCLEATGRVGGRLWSLDVAGGSLDLGATWCWAGERRVAQLVERLGLATFPQHTAGDAVYEDGRGVRRLTGNPIDVPALRYWGGAQRLTDELAARLPADTVRRSHPVTAIGVEADRVWAEWGEGIVRAGHVVLAVPPALALSHIRFSPALPEQLSRVAAATPVWMGAITKVVVQYPDAFWRTTGLAGAAVSARGPLREIHDMSGPDGQPAALFGFASTDPAMAEEQWTEQVVAQLVRLFGPDAADPHRVILRDWGAQPYTSPPEVDRLSNYGLFGHRLFAEPAYGGRLHWAGTETSPVSPGHVEGALAAGERAAAAVQRVRQYS